MVHRRVSAMLFTALLGATLLWAQAGELESDINQERIRALLPEASDFEIEHEPHRHVRGYTEDGDGGRRLVGFAFLTQDMTARFRGYNGLIQVMVGMDARGRLTGVRMVEHFEPYGYRSIDLPEYAEQFVGKSVLDAFAVGEDVDAYSGATITTAAATRSIRNASRRMARQMLAERGSSSR